MPSLTIKNIPEDLLEELRRRAVENGRNLDSEVILLLQHSVAGGRVDPEACLTRIRRLHDRIGPIPPLTDELLEQAKIEGRP